MLQPQERRAAQPGDSAEAVRARRRLHEAGHSAALLDAVRNALEPGGADVLIDAGCGEGFYAGNLQADAQCQVVGVDISTPAIELAARRYPRCTWVVANADRRLPILDESATWVISITARRTPGEFARVLRPNGGVLLALPGVEDLKELRGLGESRVAEALAPFEDGFHEVRRETITHRAHLNADEVEALRLAIYRPLQRQAALAMDVTFSLDLIILRKR